MKKPLVTLCIISLAFMLACPVATAKKTEPSQDAMYHSFWFLDLDQGYVRIRDTSADGTDPNGGVTRMWMRDTPSEVNTDVSSPAGYPYPMASDWIGASGQCAIPYGSYLNSFSFPTNPTDGEETIFVMELDADNSIEPRVYINNGIQISGVPHGYIWAGSETYDAFSSDQEVLPSGSPPTTYFELLEMEAPFTIDSFTWEWTGVSGVPGDVAGNTLGQIESWGLLESPSPSGPWTQVGKAPFGTDIIYLGPFESYYCAVPYWKGDVKSLVYSQPMMWFGHYPSRAIGPEGSSSSTGLTITYSPDCGCFGWTHLYYSDDKNVTWHYIGVEESEWGEDGVRYWVAPGEGEYWWYAGNGWDQFSCDDPPGMGTPAEAGPYVISGIPSFPFQVDDLIAYGHTPTATDVRLQWSEVSTATSYNIYRSLSVDGHGFDFGTIYATVPITGTGTVTFDDVGAYGDANNYAWIVRAYNGVEMDVDLDNIAFKLVKTLRQGTAMVGAANNYVSLPYRFAFTDSMAFLSDLRQYGSPTNSVSSVNRWDQDSGVWQSRTMFAGPVFDISPGEGYRVVASQASVTYKIVGAHDSSSSELNLFYGDATFNAYDNYISLPYHNSLLTAQTLINNMRSTGSPTNAVTSINRWNQDTGAWESRGAFAGPIFPVAPGECYLARVNQDFVNWTAPAISPGT